MTPVGAPAPGVYPPPLCAWRLLIGVLTVTQLSVILLALGRLDAIDAAWVITTSLYAHGLAVACSFVACAARAWLARLPAPAAWWGCWLALLLAAWGVSYACGVVGSVLGVGPGPAGLGRFMFVSVACVALVGAALLRYLFIRAQWRAEVIAQSEARVQALQARIRPHFLFNSLNTIASLIPEDPDGAERAIEDLADVFRGGMRRADRPIPLGEELDLGRQYLEMERRRLGDRLAIEWRVDELPQGARVPPLILQPLLENAIAHGIQGRAEGGTVRVYGREADGEVMITVSNPLAETATRPGHGMALANIRERLDLAYGGRASLVTGQDERAFFAVLTLPYVKAGMSVDAERPGR